MRRLWTAIKRFFFPPEGSPRWLRILPFAVLGVLTLAVLVGTVYGWNYTNSPEFCGSTCHTMPPEYNAYLKSPHARVRCVECHIGRDVVTTQFTRKAGDLRHVIATVTQDYEFPIFSRAMRPARESCETCHFPEKFSDDSLREIKNYNSDEENSLDSIHLIMKTGGGTRREGLGQGIHWHIENEVRYLATDKLEQDIPYVRTIDEDGNIVEYYDVASGLTPEDVAGQTLETMDCITCHNRVTHSIPTPEEAVDQAIHKGLINEELPFIRENAVDLLSREYTSIDSAFESFEDLRLIYADEYPQIYAENQGEIIVAIETLEDIYSQIAYPEQELNWETHPDNLGHKNSPGCFRCHDGKHISSGTGEVIRLECNVCHSIPAVSDESVLTTDIEIGKGPEPPSHTHTSWMTLHGKAVDSSCATCHASDNLDLDFTELEGKPPSDGSFCGNSACHDPEWTYTGFDSPELIPYLEQQLYILQNTSPYLLEGVPRTYESTFRAMFEGRCTFCHSGTEATAGLDLSTYEGALQGGQNGPGIVPGDPAASLVIARQSEARDHFGQVLDDELEALHEWILDGAPQE